KKVRFASQRIILGCPQERAQDHPNDRIDFIQHAIGEAVRDRLIVGLSYGGLLALYHACQQRKFDSLMVLVDAPVNPHTEVSPPNDGRFDAFRYQYTHRRDTAFRCAAVLSELPEPELKRIITIGTVSDDIVSPDAKHLPDIDHYELPPNIKGHRLSPEKIQAVVRIMAERLRV
ncbi:hypothetical protein HZC21_04330, partial [Candidatus Peregrinibacteria bacterium]|nr:hypothetical protein [Candidatus Peregrinibacteria bacterium]